MFFIVYLFLFLGLMSLAGAACDPSFHSVILSLGVVAGSGCELLVYLISLSILVYRYALVEGLEKELWLVKVEFNTGGLIQSNIMSVACLYLDGWGFLTINCLSLLVVLLAVLW